MNILITGGGGFVGVNLCRRLLNLKHRVTVIDNFITSDPANIYKLKNNPSLEIIRADITVSLPRQITEGRFDQIFHLACPTGVPNLTRLAMEMIDTCTLGTRNILEIAVKNSATLLFSSSSEVYGEPREFPQKESYTGNVDTTGIRSTYEEGKRFSETLVATFIRKYRLKGKIVRIFNTYGPEMSMSDSRVISAIITSALRNKPITVYGKGLQKRTFLYVDDLIDGFLKVINSDSGDYVFNLGSDREISILELIQATLPLIASESKISFKPRPQHDHSGRLPDLRRVRNLGWEIKTDLISGLKKTIAWAELQNYPSD